MRRRTIIGAVVAILAVVAVCVIASSPPETIAPAGTMTAPSIAR